MSLAFPKNARLRKSSEFRRVMTAGNRVVAGSFVVVGLMRPDDAGCRVGLVVSRKVGKAVVRNRVKRCIREVFRSCKSELDNKTVGVDFVVIARHSAHNRSFGEINQELQRSFQRVIHRLSKTPKTPTGS